MKAINKNNAITTGTINIAHLPGLLMPFDATCFICRRRSLLSDIFPFFNTQLERTGTNVSESRNEAIIAKPTARERGINIDLGTPVINRAGTKTAKMLSNIKNVGVAISLQASKMALDFDFPNSR